MISIKNLTFSSLKNKIISAGLISCLMIISGCSFNKNVIALRKVFDLGGDKINSELEKHVPPGIKSILNIQYISGDKNAFLDIYYPSEDILKNSPTIVWIHGGGWVAGNKDQIANYMKILAGKGFVTIAINYSLAPEYHHPTPVKQALQAISFLTSNAEKYKINKGKIVIAGDSGGAQIAAQTGIAISDPGYLKKLGIKSSVKAEQIAGMILHCGPYDFSRADDGDEALIFRLMLRAYFGSKKFDSNHYFNLGSVINYIPASFPKTFISVGNDDPLEEHSYILADTLISKGVPTDSLFWENKNEEKLKHEYQFNLDNDSGKEALERTVKFLNSL